MDGGGEPVRATEVIKAVAEKWRALTQQEREVCLLCILVFVFWFWSTEAVLG